MVAFRTENLKKGSFTSQFLGREPKENGFIKLNNLLAQSEPSRLKKTDVFAVIEHYNIYPRKRKDRGRILRFYVSYLKDALQNSTQPNKSIQELKALKHIFALHDRDVYHLHRKVVQNLYKKDIEALKDAKSVSETAKRFVNDIEQQLRLSDAVAKTLLKQKIEDQIENFLKTTETQTIKKSHKNLALGICDSIGMCTEFDPHTEAQLQKLKIYWCVENGKLPCLLYIAPSPRDRQKSRLPSSA